MKALFLDHERSRSPAAEAMRGGVLLLGLAVLGAAGFLYVQRSQELAGVRAQVVELRLMAKRSAGTLRARPGDTPETEAEVGRANVVLEQLNLPWLELLDAIESTRGEKVALLAITPESKQRTVRIAAEAKSVTDTLEYVRRLTAQPLFENIHLVSHEIVLQDAQKPIRFQLSAGWRLTP